MDDETTVDLLVHDIGGHDIFREHVPELVGLDIAMLWSIWPSTNIATIGITRKSPTTTD